MQLKTIIVEDEPLSRAFLKNLLLEFCPAVEIVGVASGEDEAVEMIRTLGPELVFMDIELQPGTGFEVLRRTQQQSYHIIFTTALDHSGIRAIQFSGTHYLQKPIDIESLQQLISRMVESSNGALDRIAVGHLIHTLENENIPQELIIYTTAGPKYLSIDEIISIEANGADCNFSTLHGKEISLNSNLKDYERLFTDLPFFRIHISLIANLDKISSKVVPATGCIAMINGDKLPVSAKKIDELNRIMNGRKTLSN